MDSKRIIYAVLIAQTALIIMMFQHLSKTQSTLEGLLVQTNAIQAENLKVKDQPQMQPISTSNGEGLNAVDVRFIIQEELEYFAEDLRSSIDNEKSEPVASPARLSETEIADYRANAAAQIGRMSTNGYGSQADLINFEKTIAKLPPAERIKALGELNKAINSGMIDAKF